MPLLPATHYVSAAVLDASGRFVGLATFDLNWPTGCPITDLAEAEQLAERATAEGRLLGTLPAGRRYLVLAWSEYGR